MRRARSITVVLTLTIGLMSVSTSALAETNPTPQAVGMNATWMQYLPPPATNPAICVVDTGVDITPDTAPILVDRLSVTADQGVDDTAPESGHGTIVASLIGAPRNGVGGVGLWPHARVVSVRATDHASNFVWQRYAVALSTCAKVSGVRVVNLSVAGEDPGPEKRPLFEDVVASLRGQGIIVVAAAGNERGSLLFPASAAGVVPVAANQNGGSLCASSSRRSGVLSAPGCDVVGSGRSGREVTVDGASFASPMATTIIASLLAYRPDLTSQQVEDVIYATGRQQDDGSRAIDAEAAFRAAGMGAMVEQATSAREVEGVGGSATRSGTATASTHHRPVAAPRIRWVKVQRHHVVIRLREPAPKGQRILLLGRRARMLNTTTIRAPRVNNRWKLSILSVETTTKNRSRAQDLVIPRYIPAIARSSSNERSS